MFYNEMKKLAASNTHRYDSDAVDCSRRYYVFLGSVMFCSDLEWAEAEEKAQSLFEKHPTEVITIIMQQTVVKAVRRIC